MLGRCLPGEAMAGEPGWIRQEQKDGRTLVSAGGAWTIGDAAALGAAVDALPAFRAGRATFDLSAISVLDTAGVWLLQRVARHCDEAGAEVEFRGLADRFRPLFDLVAANRDCTVAPEPPRHALAALLERVGRAAFVAWDEAVTLTGFLGVATITGAALPASAPGSTPCRSSG